MIQQNLFINKIERIDIMKVQQVKNKNDIKVNNIDYKKKTKKNNIVLIKLQGV